MLQGVYATTRLPRQKQAVAMLPRQTALISTRLEMEMLGTSACLNMELRGVGDLSALVHLSRHHYNPSFMSRRLRFRETL